MRPQSLFPLFADLTTLKGVGPRLAALMEKVAGPRVKDLVFTAPTGLVDRTHRVSISDAGDAMSITRRLMFEYRMEADPNAYSIMNLFVLMAS